MARLRPSTLIVHDLSGRRVAVAGREPDVPPSNLPEFSRPSAHEGSLEGVQTRRIQVESDGGGRTAIV